MLLLARPTSLQVPRRGIGRATAMLLADCGASVVMNGRDGGRLNETLSSLRW